MRPAKNLTLSDVFMLGYQFRQALDGAWDARDVGRVLTCDFMPKGFADLAGKMPWTKPKNEGVAAALLLIRNKLDAMTLEELEPSELMS